MAQTAFQSYYSKTQGAQAQVLTGIAVGGVEEFRETLARFGEGAVDAAKSALYVIAEEIMTEAKKLTPVYWGNLRDSGHVQLPEEHESWITVMLGFGGPAGSGNQGDKTNTKDVGYALPVHERLDVHHPIGQAKYLEQPMLEAARDIEKRLAAELRAELGTR